MVLSNTQFWGLLAIDPTTPASEAIMGSLSPSSSTSSLGGKEEIVKQAVDRLAQEEIRSVSSINVSEQDLSVFDWKVTREYRYLVILEKFAQFEIGGNSVEDLSKNSSIKNPHLKKLLNLLSDVKHSQKTLKEARTELYQKAIDNLRLAVSSSNLSNLDQTIVHELCYAFCKIDIEKTIVGKAFTNQVLGDYQPKNISQLNAQKLEESLRTGLKGKTTNQKVTDLARKFSANNLVGTWDPLSYSIRSHLATLEIGGRDVTFLRTAAPVLGANSDPEIDPIFLGMLRKLKAEGKQYLYINNQSADKASDTRSLVQPTCESNRVIALRKLAQSEEFSEMFHVVSFAHDSSFYKDSTDSDAKAYIAQFMFHLFHGKEGFFLPGKITHDNARAKKEIFEILTKVHDKYFKNEKTFTPEEKKEFLHIAYSAISQYLIETLKIDLANITCKDGVDRAAGSAANLFQYANPNVDFDLLLWTLSFPATLNHARPPKGHRHEVSIATLKRIAKNQGASK